MGVTMYAIVNLAVTAVVLFILPLAAVIFWKRRNGEKVSWKPLFIGAAGFIVSVRVLELIVHMFCIVMDNPVSRFINGNTAVYVIYGIMMAGIFEECGRYIIIRFLMKKNKTRENMVMYGIGHGGIEVWAISLMAVISYLMIAVMVYTEGTENALAALGMAGGDPAYQLMLDNIAGFGVSTSVLWIAERVFCMLIHISLTLVVFEGIQKGTKKYLLLAIFFHAVVDIMPALYQRGVVPLYVSEIWLAVCCIALLVWVKRRSQSK